MVTNIPYIETNLSFLEAASIGTLSRSNDILLPKNKMLEQLMFPLCLPLQSPCQINHVLEKEASCVE